MREPKPTTADRARALIRAQHPGCFIDLASDERAGLAVQLGEDAAGRRLLVALVEDVRGARLIQTFASPDVARVVRHHLAAGRSVTSEATLWRIAAQVQVTQSLSGGPVGDEWLRRTVADQLRERDAQIEATIAEVLAEHPDTPHECVVTAVRILRGER